MRRKIELLILLILIIIAIVLLLSCTQPIPGDYKRYIIDMPKNTTCEPMPMLRSNTGADDDIPITEADSFYAHSPLVETNIRKEFARIQRRLEACEAAQKH